MTRSHTIIGTAGLGLALIGLMALWFPVYLDQSDIYGVKISCGNGFSAKLDQAAQAGAVAKCASALLVRRAWAIPAVALGWLLVAGFLFAWVRAAEPTDETSST